MSRKLLLLLLLPFFFCLSVPASAPAADTDEVFTLSLFELPGLNFEDIMPPGWQEQLFIWNPPADYCFSDTSPLIVSGPNRVEEGQSASWQTSKGCIDYSAWRNPPLEITASTPERPAGIYFHKQICSLTNSDPQKPALQKNFLSTDRFLSFEQSAGNVTSSTLYSASSPGACSFSAEEMSVLSAGEHTLSVSIQAIRAAPRPLGGWDLGVYSTLQPSERSFDFVAPDDFQVEVSRGGRVFSLDERIDCPGRCKTRYPRGTEVQLRAEPLEEGWEFSRWTSADSPAVCGVACQEEVREPVGVIDGCTSDTRCVVSTDQISNIRAEFVPVDHTLAVTKIGQGDVISTPEGIECGDTCAAPFPVRSQVELEADGAPGWYFDGWSGACQGARSTCTLQISENKKVEARFVRMTEPVISGPEVINPTEENPGRRDQWNVLLRGNGPVVCEIREREVYTGGREVEEEFPGDLRRWQSNCSRGLTATGSEFATPSRWQGCPEADGECSWGGEDRSARPVREFDGLIHDLPDGEYTLVVRQTWIDETGDERGYVESEKDFYLDRMLPEPVRTEASSQESLPEGNADGYIVWTFDWGEDLTQTGDRVDGSGRADVRCRIVSAETGAPVEGIPSEWGGCREGAIPFSEGVEGIEGAGEVRIPADLADGKYFLEIEQRDRVNESRLTRVPFFQLRNSPQIEERGKDLVRFGARWQNIFVASTKPPAPSEGVIGDAWHPLRCGVGGTGLLQNCLLDEFTDASDIDAEDLDPDVADPELLWNRSIPLASKAQGYLRLATPGRFETNLNQRRYAHIRLFPQGRERGDLDTVVPFCSAWQNPADPLYQPDVCEENFPVQSATLQLRGTDIVLSSRSDWNVQNTITGNSELHVCMPGVPRALSSSRLQADGASIVDLWDGEEGTLVRENNANNLLGPAPSEDCAGYVFYWRWDEPVLDAYTPAAIYAGASQPELCQARPPSESDVEAPLLSETWDEAAKIGSYRWSTSAYPLPYQSSPGTPRWQNQAEGDPFLRATAPWISPVRCQNGGFLSAEAGSWELADIGAARSDRLTGLLPRSKGSVAEAGFGRNHFALPPQEPYGGPSASNLDGNPNNLEEEWVVDFQLQQPSNLLVRWFMDARYYGYHLQRWAYQTDVASAKRWISVFAPRSSR